MILTPFPFTFIFFIFIRTLISPMVITTIVTFKFRTSICFMSNRATYGTLWSFYTNNSSIFQRNCYSFLICINGFILSHLFRLLFLLDQEIYLFMRIFFIYPILDFNSLFNFVFVVFDAFSFL